MVNQAGGLVGKAAVAAAAAAAAAPQPGMELQHQAQLRRKNMTNTDRQKVERRMVCQGEATET